MSTPCVRRCRHCSTIRNCACDLARPGKHAARLFTAEVNVPRFEQLYRQLIDAKHTRQNPNGADAKHSVETVKWQSGA